ncbi:hypothetical protein GCM10010398_63600 [Streptomyces fimbriatus]
MPRQHGAQVTGNTSAQRRRGISEDRAANHNRSAGPCRTGAASCRRNGVLVPQDKQFGILRSPPAQKNSQG